VAVSILLQSGNYVRLKWLVPIGLGIILRLLPAPAGLSANAWHYFALFIRSMFLTALAPNLLALDIAKKMAKVDVSWTACA